MAQKLESPVRVPSPSQFLLSSSAQSNELQSSRGRLLSLHKSAKKLIFDSCNSPGPPREKSTPRPEKATKVNVTRVETKVAQVIKPVKTVKPVKTIKPSKPVKDTSSHSGPARLALSPARAPAPDSDAWSAFLASQTTHRVYGRQRSPLKPIKQPFNETLNFISFDARATPHDARHAHKTKTKRKLDDSTLADDDRLESATEPPSVADVMATLGPEFERAQQYWADIDRMEPLEEVVLSQTP